MKSAIRWIAGLLLLAMALSAVACGKSGENETTDPIVTTTAAAGGDATTATVPAETEPENPLDQLDFDQAPITVVYWKDVERPEFEAEEINGNPVNDAIYERNLQVEERLNVKLQFVPTAGNGGNINAYTNFVGNAYKAGESEYDLLASYSRSTATCAINGYCADMLSLDYLNFENPWWPSSLMDVVGIGDSIYFASGDASVNVLHFMYATYYNKDMIEEFKLEDPVTLVREHKWTIAKMQEMSKDVYQDLDNDGAKSAGDLYGTTVGNFHLDALYTGSGLRLVEKGEDEDELIRISQDFFSEKAVNLCATVGAWLQTQDVYNKTDPVAFVNGNCIFDINRCYLADQLQNVDWSYGILPVPMYDEEQEDYISVVGNPFTLYGIYGNSQDTNRASAALECWAEAAYQTTTPAQFETTMKLKYSETSNESEMYDIIRTTVCFDMGRLFNNSLAAITDIFFAAVDRNQSWTTVSAQYTNILPKYADKINKSFLDQQDQ